jgi:NADH-quinone oxidoreductase subunit L
MTVPIVVLAIPAAMAGYAFKGYFDQFFVPPMPAGAVAEAAGAHIGWLPFVASGMGLLGFFLAWFFYCRPSTDPVAVLETERRPTVWKWLYHKFYFDELYYWVTRNILFAKVAEGLKWIDHNVIDGCGTLLTVALQKGGTVVRSFQTGHVMLYISILLLGLLFWRALGGF